jgi:hypothetical protein
VEFGKKAPCEAMIIFEQYHVQEKKTLLTFVISCSRLCWLGGHSIKVDPVEKEDCIGEMRGDLGPP